MKWMRPARRGADRSNKLAVAELDERTTRRTTADFLRRLIAAVLDRVYTVLTNNGTDYIDPNRAGWRPAGIRRMLGTGEAFYCHAFALASARNDIDHRLTKPSHPRRGLLTASPPEIGARVSWRMLEQRSGRAHEPDDQGRHRPPLSR